MEEKNDFTERRAKSLYNISAEYRDIEMELFENGGEITPELETKLIINENELKEKSQNYVYVIKKLENECDYIENEIKRLRQAKRVRESTIRTLKNSISNAMTLYEITEIDLITNKINFRKSENVVIDCDASDLPKELQVLEIKAISKIEIKKMLKSGKTFDDVYLQENKNLQIK